MKWWPLPHATSAKQKPTAQALGIPKAYGCYEELLADPRIEAIYNPASQSAPRAMVDQGRGSGQACFVRETSQPHCRGGQNPAGRARPHGCKDGRGIHGAYPSSVVANARIDHLRPDWIDLRSIAGFFSYFNIDPANIRNISEYGGGALMDIGCYPINTSRFIFGEEPLRVLGW